MKSVSLKLVTIIVIQTFASVILINAQAFTTAQLDSANTAKSVTQLSTEEKNVIKLINLARMYPKQFAKVSGIWKVGCCRTYTQNMQVGIQR